MKLSKLIRKTFSKERMSRVLYFFIRKRMTSINVLKTFPAHATSSAGKYKLRAQLTIKSINQTPTASYNFIKILTKKEIHTITINQFLQTFPNKDNSSHILKESLDKYGSDKATTHDYFLIYNAILTDRTAIRKIFEIGLGTNYTDIVSNMGKGGHPGASLRAFRDFYPNAQIYGADIDERILFQEERITTYFIDQTNPETFDDLNEKIGNQFDLMIDDGLHMPSANIHSLTFFLPKLKVGGWAIVEDIGYDAVNIWKTISLNLPDNYKPHIIHTKAALMFAVKRLN